MLGPALSCGSCIVMCGNDTEITGHDQLWAGSLSPRVRRLGCPGGRTALRSIANSQTESGFADAVDHAGCVEQGIDLIDQLFEVERNLDRLLCVPVLSAGF